MLFSIIEVLVIIFIVTTGLISAIYILNIISGKSTPAIWPFLLFVGILFTSYYIGQIGGDNNSNFTIENEINTSLRRDGIVYQEGYEEGYSNGYTDGIEHTIKSAIITKVTERGCYIEYNGEEHYYEW